MCTTDLTLTFISHENLIQHVYNTIKKYGEKLNSYNLTKFNKNYIDPIKLLFDKMVYDSSWEEIIKNEIFRQRDKSNNNDIGYFHQNIFQYIDGCDVPTVGWDVVYKNTSGIALPDDSNVTTLYIEMKNKHNTMNSASSGKTYMKMQNQILHEDTCACLLVEAIAKKSQNIKWITTIEGKRLEHKLIRRVSIDQFYKLVTGVDNAFYQICMILPHIIQQVISSMASSIVPRDTVFSELQASIMRHGNTNELSMEMALYLLGFRSYIGFPKES